jgi:hypothetical protein
VNGKQKVASPNLHNEAKFREFNMSWSGQLESNSSLAAAQLMFIQVTR